MILGLLPGLGHRCLQLLRSSCEGTINAIDEFHDIFLFIEVYGRLQRAEDILENQ